MYFFLGDPYYVSGRLSAQLGYFHCRTSPLLLPNVLFFSSSPSTSNSTTYTAHLPAMAVLEDLPYETLAQCLSHLSCADLASMIRVSRRFHDVSQPLLYRSPCLTNTPSTLPRILCSLGIFLRTLLSPGREALGSQVRSLRLTLDDTDHVSEYPPDALARITAIASHLGIANPVALQGPHLMILLELLPRLHALHISPPNARFLETATTLPRGIQSLRSLHYIPTPLINFIKWKRIISALRLDALRRLDLRHTTICLNRVGVAASAPAGFSTITHLRMSMSSMTFKTLHTLLAVPRALTHFACDVESAWYFSLPSFMKAMAPFRHTLRCLRLEFEDPVFEEPTAAPPVEDALRGWTALRSLTCPLLLLMGVAPAPDAQRLVHLVPPGLCELEVIRDAQWGTEEVVRQVVEMLECKTEETPGLERLAVGELGGPDAEMVVAACAVAGVSLVNGVGEW